jgi:hypothetical protein
MLNNVAKEVAISAAEHKRCQHVFREPRKIYLKILSHLSKEKSEV